MTFGVLYILDGADNPVECPDPVTWARWSQSHLVRRTLAEDEAGEVVVRTVFTGIDVQVLDDGPPLLFNSEVFLTMERRLHEGTIESRFYSAYVDAMLGHVALVEAFGKVSGIIVGAKA